MIIKFMLNSDFTSTLLFIRNNKRSRNLILTNNFNIYIVYPHNNLEVLSILFSLR